MNEFVMDGIVWRVRRVFSTSVLLFDRTGHQTVATTDPHTHTVFLSEQLSGDFLRRVLAHELVHCVMVSYNMLPDISRMIRTGAQVEMEEWVCNLVSDYGREIFAIVDSLEV